MNKKSLLPLSLIFTVFLSVFCISNLYSQDTIKITQQSFKLNNSSKIDYYGFAEGDKVMFSFSEMKYKGIDEIIITEYNSNNIIFKMTKPEFIHEIIDIPNTGIYKFKFTVGAFKSRDCEYILKRIPKDESKKNFNTSVYWETLFDTVAQQKVVYDTITETILNKPFTIHSQTNSNGNRLTCKFDIPKNTYRLSYNISISLSEVKNVECKLVDYENANYFMQGLSYKYLKDISVFNKKAVITNSLNGSYAFIFTNNNMFTGINISVNVQAQRLLVNKTVENVVKTRKVPYLKE